MKMTRLIIFIIFVLSQTIYGQETWFWQNPWPQGNDLNDVWVLENGNVFAVGDRGTLLRSEDGGNNWQVTHRILGNDEDIVDIEFISDLKGWLLSNIEIYDERDNVISFQSFIYTTVDAGLHWEIIAQFDSIRLKDLSFINPNQGWATGHRMENIFFSIAGIVLKTENSGYDWIPSKKEQIDSTYWPGLEAQESFSNIQFIDADTGWVSGLGQLHKTTDGGLNWNIVADSLGIVDNFQFLNSAKGWLIECDVSWYFVDYYIKKTMNGGQSWDTEFNIESGSYNLPTVYFTNSDSGWIIARNIIHETTNGGLNWDSDTLDFDQELGAIHLNSSYQGCAVGKYGTILTRQSQVPSWQQSSYLTMTNDLKDINFLDENIGFTIGDKSYYSPISDITTYKTSIFKTNDGGFSWEKCFELYPRITDEFFLTMQIVSDQIIYIGGQGSYKSSNGGIDWQEMTLPPATKVNDLYFLNADTGFVVTGWNHNTGHLSKTCNGGLSWQTILSTTMSIQALCFSDSLNGWAVGWRIPIYKTIDGGNSWFEASLNEDRLRSVFFNNPDTGWAVGSSGNSEQDIILKTTDGGSIWEIVYSINHGEFNSIYFKDTNTGIVIGKSNDYPNKGIIMYTTDGGVTWNEEFSIATKGLNNIFFLNEQTGWIVGEEGTVIKTTSGGITSVKNPKTISHSIPSEFTLSQNYPNPFNPKTTIVYQISKSSNVELNIYNLLGQKVSTLVSKKHPAGSFKVEWDASGFASGLYFYRLETDKRFVQSKKLILLK